MIFAHNPYNYRMGGDLLRKIKNTQITHNHKTVVR